MSGSRLPSDLLIFSLGPVQDYIVTARRTQDLAAASAILSCLAEAAIQKALAFPGSELISPYRVPGLPAAGLPNRMILRAPQGQAADLAYKMEEAVNARRSDIATAVKAHLNTIWNDTIAGPQLENWVEIYWASARWDGDDGSYALAFHHASLGLEARKNLRCIPTISQPGRKCTLCGIRSAMGSDAQWNALQKQTGRTALRTSERLCAVCAVKRFAVPAGAPGMAGVDRFPSTSSIAAASFRAAVLSHWETLNQASQLFTATLDRLGLPRLANPEPFPYLAALADDTERQVLLRYDGDSLYPDFYTEERVTETLPGDTLTPDQQYIIATLAQPTGPLRRLLKAVADLPLPDPPPAAWTPFPNPYYAILVLDGDQMGQLMDSAAGIDEHQTISAELGQAAARMQEIVEVRYPGRLIFSGGDDALAFLPADCALAAAQDLQREFTAALARAGRPGRTASLGIAIAHRQHPLEKALRAARAAEVDAKEVCGRNALNVLILKRSGETRQARLLWQEPDILQPLSWLRRWISSGVLSGKLAYDFLDETPGLSALSATAIRMELGRLLARHRQPEVPEPSLDTFGARAAFAEELSRLLSAAPSLPQVAPVEQLAEWLVLARFLAQGDRA